MAKRKIKEQIIYNFPLAIIILGLLIGAVFAYLDSNRKLTYGEITAGLGMSEKPMSSADMSVHYIDVGQAIVSLLFQMA